MKVAIIFIILSFSTGAFAFKMQQLVEQTQMKIDCDGKVMFFPLRRYSSESNATSFRSERKSWSLKRISDGQGMNYEVYDKSIITTNEGVRRTEKFKAACSNNLQVLE